MAVVPITGVWLCCVHSDVFNFSPPRRRALLEELEHLEFQLVDASDAQIMFYDPRLGSPVVHHGSVLKLIDYRWVEETLRAQEWALFEDWMSVRETKANWAVNTNTKEQKISELQLHASSTRSTSPAGQSWSDKFDQGGVSMDGDVESKSDIWAINSQQPAASAMQPKRCSSTASIKISRSKPSNSPTETTTPDRLGLRSSHAPNSPISLSSSYSVIDDRLSSSSPLVSQTTHGGPIYDSCSSFPAIGTRKRRLSMVSNSSETKASIESERRRLSGFRDNIDAVTKATAVKSDVPQVKKLHQCRHCKKAYDSSNRLKLHMDAHSKTSSGRHRLNVRGVGPDGPSSHARASSTSPLRAMYLSNDDPIRNPILVGRTSVDAPSASSKSSLDMRTRARDRPAAYSRSHDSITPEPPKHVQNSDGSEDDDDWDDWFLGYATHQLDKDPSMSTTTLIQNAAKRANVLGRKISRVELRLRSQIKVVRNKCLARAAKRPLSQQQLELRISEKELEELCFDDDSISCHSLNRNSLSTLSDGNAERPVHIDEDEEVSSKRDTTSNRRDQLIPLSIKQEAIPMVTTTVRESAEMFSFAMDPAETSCQPPVASGATVNDPRTENQRQSASAEGGVGKPTAGSTATSPRPTTLPLASPSHLTDQEPTFA